MLCKVLQELFRVFAPSPADGIAPASNDATRTAIVLCKRHEARRVTGVEAWCWRALGAGMLAAGMSTVAGPGPANGQSLPPLPLPLALRPAPLRARLAFRASFLSPLCIFSLTEATVTDAKCKILRQCKYLSLPCLHPRGAEDLHAH